MSNRKRLLIEEVVFPEAAEIYAAELDVFYALPDEKRRSYRGQSAPLEGRDERLRLVRRAHEEQLHQVHALHCKQPITGEIMDRAPMLEVIIVPGSGADLVDLDAATDRAIAAAEFHTRMAVQIATDAVAALRGERGGQLANPAVWDAFSTRLARSS